MKGIRDIKRRIKAVKNTGQITRAMQLVAAAKMKQAQQRTLSHRPYALLFHQVVSCLGNRIDKLVHPLLEARPVKKRGILCISSDKGLCGPLNTNLARAIQAIPKDSAHFICAGDKALQALSRIQYSVLADFKVADKLSFHAIKTIAEYMLQLYLDGTIDTIEVLYPSFINTLIQETLTEKLAPIDDLSASLEGLRKTYKLKLKDTQSDNRRFEFEPTSALLLEEVPLLFIKQKIYHAFLEARAAEHSARMVAMKTATDNAKKLIQSLNLEYNKARQAMITQEILEIASSSLAS